MPMRWWNRSGQRRPFSAAFSTTLMAGLFLVSGTIGYEIKKSDWSIMRGAWSDGPVWWEIWLGLVSMVLAVYFWRRALRSLS